MAGLGGRERGLLNFFCVDDTENWAEYDLDFIKSQTYLSMGRISLIPENPPSGLTHTTQSHRSILNLTLSLKSEEESTVDNTPYSFFNINNTMTLTLFSFFSNTGSNIVVQKKKLITDDTWTWNSKSAVDVS